MNPGDIYSIPLFLSDVSALKNFSCYDFTKDGMEFCFARIIEDRGGSGILIEVFDIFGELDKGLSQIISRPRLFSPVFVAGETIKKKRWRCVGTTYHYDKEKNSGYSKIKFLIGPRENRCIWIGGKECLANDSDEMSSFEEFVIWPAVQVERRILKAKL